jgi:hypothetical protein
MASTAQLIDRFDQEKQKLSAVDKAALDFIRHKIAANEQITRAEIAIAIGSQNLWGGTAPGVLNRLEAKGYITRTFYQRGLQVCDVETGECTAPPSCRAVHWRLRDQQVQTPPIHAVRTRHHVAAHIIESEARKSGSDLHDFLQDLVFNGLELWLEKQEADG